MSGRSSIRVLTVVCVQICVSSWVCNCVCCRTPKMSRRLRELAVEQQDKADKIVYFLLDNFILYNITNEKYFLNI